MTDPRTSLLVERPGPAAGPILNDGCEYREQLGPDAEGRTVTAYLVHCYAHSTEQEWKERIAAGQVLIDGRAGKADEVLKRGSELIWQRPPWIEPDAPRLFSILYEDDDLLAVVKPAGLPTLPGANFLQNTLLSLVSASAPNAAPLHRLGRWTSGIVLFSRNQGARRELIRQWSGNGMVKRYRALASGSPEKYAMTIDLPIGPVPHELLGTVHAASPDGKRARSRVTVLEQRQGSFLCDVVIETGRPHQIRIHLASTGHPLVGDPLYGTGGVPVIGTRALPGDPGYHLHALELTFRHPADGRKMTISCEPPAILRKEA